jgi:hypothetical protein
MYISVAGHFPFTWNRTVGPNARVFIHIEQPIEAIFDPRGKMGSYE